MYMKSRVVGLIFFLSLFSLESFAAVDKSRKAPRAFQALNLTAFSALEANNEPSGLNFLPRPFLTYVNVNDWAEAWQFSFMTAGLFNQAEAIKLFENGYNLSAKVNGLFYLGGDRPRLDGDDFDGAFDFREHSWSLQLGAGKAFPLFTRAYQAQVEASYRGHRFFNDPGTTTYVIPENFTEIAVVTSLSPSRKGFNELKNFGFYPSLRLKNMWRLNSEAWGLQGSRRDVGYSLAADLEVDFGLSLRSWLALDVQSHSVYVLNADRLNAATNGSLGRDFQAFFLGNVKTDRSFKLEVGPRFYLVPSRKLAIRPFYFNAFYRELTIANERNRQVLGGGLKLMGAAYKDRFIYSLGYGAADGVIPNKVIHQFNTVFSYRFL